MLVVADTRRSVARLTPQEPENQPRALRATNLPGVPYILSMKSQENRKTVPANHMRDCALVDRSHLGSGTVPRHIAARRLILGCYFKLAANTWFVLVKAPHSATCAAAIWYIDPASGCTGISDDATAKLGNDRLPPDHHASAQLGVYTGTPHEHTPSRMSRCRQ